MRFTFLFLLAFSATLTSWAGSLDDWLELEQTRIDRTVDETKILAPDIKNQKDQFRPESQKWFKVKAIWIPEAELNVAIEEGKLDPKLRQLFVRGREGRREYRLLVHPESEKFYEKLLQKYPADEKTFRATSTASSRTVLMEANGKKDSRFFAKLSLDVELGGVRRTVPAGEVARSVGTSIYLQELENRIGSDTFVHIPEPFGISPKGWERGGMILRVVPEEVQKSKVKLVPLFSLYKVGGNGRTLLQDLAEQAKVTPLEFTKQYILKPFYEGWTKWNLQGDVTMEAHAQNVLLELDSKNKPTGRFVHRDLGGFSIDANENNLFQKLSLPVFSDKSTDYHQPFVDDARKQTLSTYFEGGFLFNVDKELLRTDPLYESGSIYREGRKILSETLTRQSGVKKIAPEELASGWQVLQALKKSKAVYFENKSASHPCAESFQKLSR